MCLTFLINDKTPFFLIRRAARPIALAADFRTSFLLCVRKRADLPHRISRDFFDRFHSAFRRTLKSLIANFDILTINDLSEICCNIAVFCFGLQKWIEFFPKRHAFIIRKSPTFDSDLRKNFSCGLSRDYCARNYRPRRFAPIFPTNVDCEISHAG